jgi:hypothetical protein
VVAAFAEADVAVPGDELNDVAGCSCDVAVGADEQGGRFVRACNSGHRAWVWTDDGERMDDDTGPCAECGAGDGPFDERVCA